MPARSLTALAAMLLAGAGCSSGSSPTQPSSTDLLKVRIHTNGPTEGPAGAVIEVWADVYESDCQMATCGTSPVEAEVSWQSSDPTVAQLGGDGPGQMEVRFLKAGKATIIASAKGTQGFLDLTVTP